MIDRVVDILDSFLVPGGLTLAQVVGRTGLPRSSAHRILDQLVRTGWLRRDEFVYHLGARVRDLGAIAAHEQELRAAAAPHLRELHASTGLAAQLSLLDGSDIALLDNVAGRFTARVSGRAGDRFPAVHTAAGKAMLGFATDAVAEAVLATPGVEVARTRAELRAVRACGIAFDREEALHGIGSVAAPLTAPGARPAAIAVSGPIQHLDMKRLVSPVRAAAHKITCALSCSPSAETIGYVDCSWPVYPRHHLHPLNDENGTTVA
ncbi:IclR family transcriptional regulator [Sciscionella marina]|uniref:IclR family transcriptional regulator n=1 Tax=Sciscionella marina TaxID=508770 RepID=UPI00146F037F|nr:IclR family transcriptional regulator [Sciscionella marina]